MEKRTSVKGILHDSAGQPVRDAIVMIVRGSHSHNDIASVTNDSGEFYLSNVVVPGEYVLQINSERGSFQKEVSLSGNEVIQLQY